MWYLLRGLMTALFAKYDDDRYDQPSYDHALRFEPGLIIFDFVNCGLVLVVHSHYRVVKLGVFGDLSTGRVEFGLHFLNRPVKPHDLFLKVQYFLLVAYQPFVVELVVRRRCD